MTATPPNVGVVMPLYNGASYVGEAVDSALAAGSGIIKRIVVVDDGSDDDGLAIAESRGEIVEGVRMEHAGVSAARNRGVAMLDTELITFLDADDIWPLDSLSVRLAFLESNPEVDGVYGGIEQFVCPTLSDARRKQLRFTTTQNPVPMVTAMLLRRERFHHAGLFRTKVGNAENLEWLLRARETGLVLKPIDSVVLRRRIHGSNSTTLNRSLGLEYVRVLRAHLARKGGNRTDARNR